MTLALASVGTVLTSASSNPANIAPAYPASIAAGDGLLLLVGFKPNGVVSGGSVTTPSGWTALGSITGSGSYAAVPASDTGNGSVWAFTKTAAGTESGSLTVTLTTVHVAWAVIIRFTKDAAASFSWGWASAERTTAPTSGASFGVTMGSNPGLIAGDIAVVAVTIPTNTGTATWSAESVSATSATFGSATEAAEIRTSTGFDLGGLLYYASCTAGPATAAPVATQTFTGTVTNVKGPWGFVRVREVPPTTAGQASETDAAQAVARVKSRTLGQASETDVAQAVTATLTGGGTSVNLGQAAETDAAQAAGRRKARAVGQASSTEVAQAVGRRKARTAGQASTTDAAQAVARRKSRAAAQATEVDVAQAVTRRAAKAVGQASDASTAQAVTRRASRILGQATETDSAQAVARRKARTAAQATETDAAQAVARRKARTLGQAPEADLAQPVTEGGSTAVAVAQATETDLAQAVARAKRKTVGQALDVSTAQAVGRRASRAVATAVEVDAAQPAVRRKARTAAQAADASTAQPVARRKARTAAQATSTDVAQALGRRKAAPVGRAAEVDTAGVVQLPAALLVPVGQAVEVEAAGAITVVRGSTTPASGGGWWGLAEVRATILDGRAEERVRPRCERCGDLLQPRPDGVLVCAFDGWPYPPPPHAPVRVRPAPEPRVECDLDGERLVTDPRSGRLVCVFCGSRY